MDDTKNMCDYPRMVYPVRLAWIILLAEILLISLFNFTLIDIELLSIVAIGIHVIIVFLALAKYKDKELGLIMFLGYSIRLMALFWDIYGRSVYVLPHSGSDTEGFFYFAGMVSNDLSLLSGYVYGKLYTKFLGLLFYFVGPERLIAQYINVLLGLSTIMLVYNILLLLDIRTRIIKVSVICLSFFPHSVIFSAILLRENMVIFFMVLSFYCFTKWYKYKTNRKRDIGLSILSLMIASAFHSGIAAVFAGYFFMILLYSHKKRKLVLKYSSLFVFIVGITTMFFLVTKLKAYVLPTFVNVDSIEDIYRAVNYRHGEAAYLKWLEISSVFQGFLYAPLRIAYFLWSPLPMDWRGAPDIFAFLLDSIIYLGLALYIFFNMNKCGRDPLLKATLISLITVLFVFAFGVSNAGTALRHRNKILPLLIIAYSLIANIKQADKQRHQLKEDSL